MSIGVECDDSTAIAKIFNVVFDRVRLLFISFAEFIVLARSRGEGYTRNLRVAHSPQTRCNSNSTRFLEFGYDHG